MTRVTDKEGQGGCKRCSELGKYSRTWMCFLYTVEGQEGYYCKEHAEEVEKNADRATIAQ